MIVTTTPSVEGYRVERYCGLVHGETVNGINALKDIGAGLRNVFGGRSAGYEEELIKARQDALDEMERRAQELGANAIIGLIVDVEAMGAGDMLVVSATGTAVQIVPAN